MSATPERRACEHKNAVAVGYTLKGDAVFRCPDCGRDICEEEISHEQR
jgi:hypothetical protein